MISLSLDCNGEQFKNAIYGIKQLAENYSAHNPYLGQLIRMKLETDYEVVVSGINLIDTVFEGKYNGEYSLSAVGVYWSEMECVPKIFLCSSRAKAMAEDLGISPELFYASVMLHEVGHHVFDFVGLRKSLLALLELSEGAANYFVYLIANNEIRAILDKTSANQPSPYRFYKRFVEWEQINSNECITAFGSLAKGDQASFLNAFIRYLISECQDEIFAEGMLKKLVQHFSTEQYAVDLFNNYYKELIATLKEWSETDNDSFINAVGPLVQRKDGFLTELALFCITNYNSNVLWEPIASIIVDTDNKSINYKELVDSIVNICLNDPARGLDILKKCETQHRIFDSGKFVCAVLRGVLAKVAFESKIVCYYCKEYLPEVSAIISGEIGKLDIIKGLQSADLPLNEKLRVLESVR